MNTRGVVVGATMGSALMFLLDPERSRGWQASVRGKATRIVRMTRDRLSVTRRRRDNPASGTAATRPEPAIDDDRLAARVRGTLERVSPCARVVEIVVQNGCVTVRGPVPSAEAAAVVTAIASVPGVLDIVDELDPSQQGSHTVTWNGDADPRMRARSWLPGSRTMVGAGLVAAGVWMAVAASRSRHGDVGDGGYADAAM